MASLKGVNNNHSVLWQPINAFFKWYYVQFTCKINLKQQLRYYTAACSRVDCLTLVYMQAKIDVCISQLTDMRRKEDRCLICRYVCLISVLKLLCTKINYDVFSSKLPVRLAALHILCDPDGPGVWHELRVVGANGPALCESQVGSTSPAGRVRWRPREEKVPG